MNEIQNEICYVAAWQILHKLFANGYITEAEFKAAHDLTARQYRPLAVREKQ